MTPTAKCPHCSKAHEVKQAWSQSTRYEPAWFLGLDMYCPSIDCHVPVASIELVQWWLLAESLA